MAHRMFERLSRRLYLDKKNGWLAGLCAGIATYFAIDPAFVRVGVVVTALFFPKLVIAAYLVGWLLIDER
ncbi:MAG: PspC domain-containing protein [Proteobacteria bacterium]|nr:PspC domain-containing protein [Pseudomonadota bacterium]